MSKYGKPLTLEEMRPIQLRMIEDIDRVCKENGLRYSMSGGTLLGAVRHKGFIPWDDDVDIMLPRPDYEKFKKVFPSSVSDEYMVDYRSDDSFYKVFTKIFDKSTTMIQRAVERGGVFVDVFAIDGQPSDEEALVEYVSHYRKLNKAIRWHTDYFFKSPNFFIRTVVRALKGHSMKKRLACIDEVEELLGSYPFETSEYAGAVTGGSGVKTHQKRELYETFADYEFEGHTFRGVKDYDRYLTLMYGDYMTPPPEGERASTHMAKFYYKKNGA